MKKIKKLSNNIINLISAGEVVERPASVVKELIENSIDAGASKIDVWLEQGGKNLIVVEDDGYGISKEDLLVAVEEYTTSKLNQEDLMDITTLGFRGEALASIAAISRLKITSKERGAINAYILSVIGGEKGNVEITNYEQGTKIEIRDLFFATPARLKFLKNDKLESIACLEVIKKMAISYSHIGFQCYQDGKLAIKYNYGENLQERIQEILGEQFIKNSVPLEFDSDVLKIKGFVSLPTYHKATTEDQFFFVNNRAIKDKTLFVSVKIAYQDFIMSGRHPTVVLLLVCDKYFIDVNVHPTKREIRFRDVNLVRTLVSKAISNAIKGAQYLVVDNSPNLIKSFYSSNDKSLNFRDKENGEFYSFYNKRNEDIPNKVFVPVDTQETFYNSDPPLGHAYMQFFDTYIISKTKNSLIIVDQHAAHERIVYEKIKEEFDIGNLIEQKLLIPQTVDLIDHKRQVLMDQNKEELAKFAIHFNVLGEKSLIVKSIPLFLTEVNIIELIQDISNDLVELDANISMPKLIEKIIETFACHHSIRAGKRLNIDEMNELLRQIEATPHSGQCNHGRPTYIELRIKDLDKLFGR